MQPIQKLAQFSIHIVAAVQTVLHTGGTIGRAMISRRGACANSMRDLHEGSGPEWAHLTSWLVETSAREESWRRMDHEDDSRQLNGEKVTGTFGVAGGGECHFV
jgi:hypothetical protein